jgi:hypothetical protein
MVHRDDAPQTAPWFRSSYSDNQGGQCVEAARIGTGTSGTMWVRDSKDPDGPAFEFGPAAWTSFVQAASEGEFRDRNA